MNKYQRILAAVALINALVIVLCPPFSSVSLSKYALPGFEGFYPVFAAIGHKPIHIELLSMELFLLGANFLTAWLMLAPTSGAGRNSSLEPRFGAGILIVATANVLIMVLFPPFEPYSSTMRPVGASFDSFYFVFGTRTSRPIYEPLLYLELTFVATNALLLWLLFQISDRQEGTMRAHVARLAESADATELASLTADMRSKVEAHRRAHGSDEAHHESRHQFDPTYRGPERRKRDRG